MKLIIITCTPPGCDERVTNLACQSYRRGFPNAKVEILKVPHTTSHFSILTRLIIEAGNTLEPLVICDGDVIFWDNLEEQLLADWEEIDFLLAGDYIPSHMNPYSNSFYMDRIHTSLMFIPEPVKLVDRMIRLKRGGRAGTEVDAHNSAYLSSQLIAPYYTYIDGYPIYYDTSANLYQAIQNQCHVFGVELETYDHVNSASFYPEVCKRLTGDPLAVFKKAHELAVSDPDQLKGLNHEVKKFYINRSVALEVYLKDPDYYDQKYLCGIS